MSLLQNDFFNYIAGWFNNQDSGQSQTAAQLAQCQADLVTKQTAINTANASIASLNTQKTQLLAQIAALNTEPLTAQIVQLSNDLATANNSLSAVQAQKSALDTQVSTLTGSNNALTASVADKQSQIDALNAQILSGNTDLNGQITTLNSQLTTLQGQISGLNSQVSTLTSANSALTTQKNTLTTQNSSLSSQLTAAQTDVSSKNAQITSLNSQITTLNGQITSLKAQVASLQAQIVNGATKPRIGANVHPFSSTSYTDWTKMFADLRAMKMNSIRFDIQLANDGTYSNPTKLQQLIDMAAPDISLHPVINIDGDDVRNGGYARCFTIFKRFAQDWNFPTYELGNEMAIKVLTTGGTDKAIQSGDGLVASNYNLTTLNLVVQAMKGASDGIYAGRPGATTMVDESWKHTYYIDALIAGGVKFDILAWHQYTEQYQANGSQSFQTLLEGKYPTKTIWWNEVGRRASSDGSFPSYSHDAMLAMTAEFIQKGFFVYELYDEPGRSGNVESTFGIYTSYGVPKSIAAEMKALWS